MINPALQRTIMGSFATGVTVVTTCYGARDQIWGMTANSFTSVSLDPPLVLFAIDRRNSMYRHLLSGQCFAVNILTSLQEAVSRQFSAGGPKDFSQINLTVAVTGAPILAGSLAFLDCRVVQNISSGDHDIFIGEIVAGAVYEGQPLIFHNASYRRLATSGTGHILRGKNSLVEAYDHYASI